MIAALHGDAPAAQQLAGADAERQFRWLSEAATTHRYAHEWMQAIAIYQELMAKDVEHTDEWLWNTGVTQRDGGMLKEAIGTFRQCTTPRAPSAAAYAGPRNSRLRISTA